MGKAKRNEWTKVELRLLARAYPTDGCQGVQNLLASYGFPERSRFSIKSMAAKRYIIFKGKKKPGQPNG